MMRRFEALVNLAIVTPLGVGATLVEDVPKVVARGRREIVLARFIGKMVVTHGLGEVQRRFARPDASDVPPVDDAARAEVTAAASLAAEAIVAGIGVTPDDLVLPDYDHLPAAHVVAKLATLEQVERDAIEQYESAHRHRRTILGKLDQLRTE